MTRKWRVAVVALVASVLLAGCASSQSSPVKHCSASTSTSPDWVFGLLLSSGMVALVSGLVWVMFLPGVVTGPPKPRVKHWWSPAYVVFMLLFFAYTQFNARDMWTQTPDRYINAASLAVLALILAGAFVNSRRHRATGVWPTGRRAAWGFFWLLPVILVASVGAAGWAVSTMASPMVTVPC